MAIVLLGLGGTLAFMGLGLAVLSWLMGPWIGGLGAFPWVCLGVGALLIVAGGVALGRK